jgi:hypothetical protein
MWAADGRDCHSAGTGPVGCSLGLKRSQKIPRWEIVNGLTFERLKRMLAIDQGRWVWAVKNPFDWVIKIRASYPSEPAVGLDQVNSAEIFRGPKACQYYPGRKPIEKNQKRT